MAKQQARWAGPKRASRFDILALAKREHLPTYQPRVASPSHRCQRNNEVRESRPKDGGERNCQQKAREGEHDIDAAHHEVIDMASCECGRAADDTTDGERQ